MSAIGIVFGSAVLAVLLGALIHPIIGRIVMFGIPLIYLFSYVQQEAEQAQRRRRAKEEKRRAWLARVEASRQETLRRERAEAKAAMDARIAEEERRAAEQARAARYAANVAEAQAAREEAAAAKERANRARAEAEAERKRAAHVGAGDPRWGSTDPFAVLGIPRDADGAAIRKAYGALSRQYHPDRVASLGPEFIQLAESRMKAINAAYAQVRSRAK